VSADAPEPETAEPTPCSPCRGTGKLISNLGGTPSTVTCPWCDGGGIEIRGHDAQARRRAEAGGTDPAPSGAAEPAEPG